MTSTTRLDDLQSTRGDFFLHVILPSLKHNGRSCYVGMRNVVLEGWETSPREYGTNFPMERENICSWVRYFSQKWKRSFSSSRKKMKMIIQASNK